MKKVIFFYSIVSIVIIVYYSCTKETQLKQTEPIQNSVTVEEDISGDLKQSTFIELESYWEAEITKNDFMKHYMQSDVNMSTAEINSVSGRLPNIIKIIFTVKEGVAEEFISLKGNQNTIFFKQISHPVNTSQDPVIGKLIHNIYENNPTTGIPEKIIEIIEDNVAGKVSFNQNIVNAYQKKTVKKIIAIGNPSIMSYLCCKACYTVHDILDIHILDCLCCLASCNYSCFK